MAESVKRVPVHGYRLAYREVGEGAPIIFLHGNPTHSYLWRKIQPRLRAFGRCLAPDLIGMGASDKLSDDDPDRYRFLTHRDFLEAFLQEVGANDDVVLVVHDWGGVLGFDWARRNREAVRGICYMETFAQPATWDEYPAASRGIFERLRSDEGEQLCLEDNFFVEQMLPFGTLRELGDDEMDAYRAPFAEPGEGRRPTLTWAREVPIDGQPADVHDVVAANAKWLATDGGISKLLIRAEPGQILARQRQADFCQRWPNQVQCTVAGKHFLQEDSPDEIASAIAGWLKTL